MMVLMNTEAVNSTIIAKDSNSKDDSSLEKQEEKECPMEGKDLVADADVSTSDEDDDEAEPPKPHPLHMDPTADVVLISSDNQLFRVHSWFLRRER